MQCFSPLGERGHRGANSSGGRAASITTHSTGISSPPPSPKAPNRRRRGEEQLGTRYLVNHHRRSGAGDTTSRCYCPSSRPIQFHKFRVTGTHAPNLARVDPALLLPSALSAVALLRIRRRDSLEQGSSFARQGRRWQRGVRAE